jgi:DNA ligase (NAD+)
MDEIANASLEDLSSVPTIGPKTAQSVYEYFQEEENRALIEKLRMGGVKLKGASAAREGPFLGKIFVVTGSLLHWTRNEVESLVKNLGGAIGSSVTKKTDYLVAGENPGSKLVKAQEYGTKVLDEDGFGELLEESGVAASQLRR